MEVLSEPEPGTAIAALTSLDEVAALIVLFEHIADEEGWRPGGGLRDSVQGAVYFGVYQSGVLVGGLHLARPSAAGALPTGAVWPELSGDIRPTDAHVVVMALARNARGREGLLSRLTAEVWRYCARSGIGRIWIEATPRVYRLYVRLGWPLAVRGPARMHWGEECVPAVAGVGDIAASIASKARRSQAICSLILDTLEGLRTGGVGSHPCAPSLDDIENGPENGGTAPNAPPCPPS